MRVLKPQALSVLQRGFERQQNAYLGVAVIAFAPIAMEPALHSEQELWPAVTPLLDPEVPLDAAIPKVGGEFLVVGSAHAPRGEPATGLELEARVGSLRKVIHAYGPRTWEDGRAGPPALFTEVPCTWAEAYGGPDFAANPRGVGAAVLETPAGRHRPVPRLEYPDSPATRADAPLRPACFAALPSTWPQRRRFAGTYDDAWLKGEYPGPPADLDWRVHCVAPEDQWQPQPFAGTEAVALGHFDPGEPYLEGRLPGLRPVVAIQDRGRPLAAMRFGEPRLTTVWLFPALRRMALVWHAVFHVEDEHADSVELLFAAAEWLERPRAPGYYVAAAEARLDPEHGALKMLADEELLPEGLATPNESLARYRELMGREAVAHERVGERLAKAAEERSAKLAGAFGAALAQSAEAAAARTVAELGVPPLPA
ncbi:MAG: DUF2169 domain-containing protein, partial [Proteobacteria bacterium]|nr:DUF2169 domain-containing protein [Pseudomonadota bacterium]